jgi:hypothetical protein
MYRFMRGGCRFSMTFSCSVLQPAQSYIRAVLCYAMLCRAVQVLATQQSLLTNGGCLLRSKGFVWLASCPDML